MEELEEEWRACLSLKREYEALMERKRVLCGQWRGAERRLLETTRETLGPILWEWGLMISFTVGSSDKAFIDDSRLPEGRPLYTLWHPPERSGPGVVELRPNRRYGLLAYLLPTHEEILYHLLENCPEDLLRGAYIGGMVNLRSNYLWMNEEGETTWITNPSWEKGQKVWGPMTSALSEAINNSPVSLPEILRCIPRYTLLDGDPEFAI